MKNKSKTCELCSEPATVYCAADTAYLCYGCDSSVHSANFLVARHVRWARCVTCGCVLLVSGSGGSEPVKHVCRSCGSDPIKPCCSSQSDASSCVSNKEAKRMKRRREAEELTGGRRVRRRSQGRMTCENEAVLSIARARRRMAREKEGWAESD